MFRKYYHKQEDNSHIFLESSENSNELLEFCGKRVKYRFLELISTEEYEELGYYAYKKLLDNEIKRL